MSLNKIYTTRCSTIKYLAGLVNKFFLIFFLGLIPLLAFSDTHSFIESLLKNAPSGPIDQRIDYFSHALLDKPYVDGALGEGPQGEFNQLPLYRFDAFDCQTFVETVMALSVAQNAPDFEKKINDIRYANGTIRFINRNHFPSADWLPNNQRNGFIQDITQAVAGSKNTAIKTTFINKQNWYAHLTMQQIHLRGLTPAQAETKLQALHAQGHLVKNTDASIDYIPRTAFFIDGKPNTALLARIPNGAIVLIVKQSSSAPVIGTDLNVTHMGFAIWKNNTLYFRAASSVLQRTTDIPLTDYLTRWPSIQGISLWVVK